jgi:hypothetical protein
MATFSFAILFLIHCFSVNGFTFPFLLNNCKHGLICFSTENDDSEKRSLYDLGAGKNAPLIKNGDGNVISDERGKHWIVPDPFIKEKLDDITNPSRQVSSSVYMIGKNPPIGGARSKEQEEPNDLAAKDAALNWQVPEPVNKPVLNRHRQPVLSHPLRRQHEHRIRRKRIVPRDETSKQLKAALWDEEHFTSKQNGMVQENKIEMDMKTSSNSPPKPILSYPDIDLSIPLSVYSDKVDIIWDTLRYEAFLEAEREPLLVSFLHSSILNHRSLESALAFHLANRLSSPAMISTQIQSLILDALEHSPDFRRSLRADIMAVRDRDPACNFLPDVFLYFKGFHALQTHRVAHYMYKNGRPILAHYLQSQVSQNFQIDIHPNATIGSGVYDGPWNGHCRWRNCDDWTQLFDSASCYIGWKWKEGS